MLNKRKIAYAVMATGLSMTTGSFIYLLNTDKFDEEYVMMDTRGIEYTATGAKEYGEVKSLNLDYNLAVIKTNKAKVLAYGAFSDSSIIIEPNYKYKAIAGCSLPPPSTTEPNPCPTDPTKPPPTNPNPGTQREDWGRVKINASKAWSVTNGASIKVCVADTGIDRTHPDLRMVSGKSFVGGDIQDAFGHGSHVAGIISAINNSHGIVGASQAQLYIAKVLGDQGQGDLNAIASGIQWCIQQKVDFINMSLGGDQYSQILDYWTMQAVNAGIVVVAAAGNNGGQTGYPAALRQVISIGATNQQNMLARFSSRTKVNFCAPGENTLSTVPMSGCQICNGSPEQGLGIMSGTSMAAPYATAVLALAKAAGKQVAFQQGDQMCGAGVIDAAKSVGL